MVSRLVMSWAETEGFGAIIFRNEGKKMNATTNARAMPSVIIHPKSMTGRIPLTTSEQNATMVVTAVKKQGLNMRRTVSRTRSACLASGFSATSSP